MKGKDFIKDVPSKEILDKLQLIIEKYPNLSSESDVVKIGMPADEFFLMTNFHSSQGKAVVIEDWIRHKLQANKISASDERGDCELNGDYIELKTSTTNKAQTLNLRQIRLWQNIDYYICSYIDELNVKNSKFFQLNKDEIKLEVQLMGGFTHGTNNANTHNANNEYSITVPIFNKNNNHAKRWYNNYYRKDLYNKIIGE